MTKRLDVLVAAGALALSTSATAGDSADARVPSPGSGFTLAGLRAHLFYESLGAMDERELISGKFAPWNTIIGEGDARAPSSTTIVFVDVAGPAFLTGTRGTVTFVARSEQTVLRRETVKLAEFFSEGPRLSIPFVVIGTGCGTLKLDATLVLPGHQDRMKKEVALPCGE